MGLRTPLYDAHLAAHARMVDFGGWEMPLHYGSQIEEHHVVRRDAGMFDVSHMCAIDINGPQARDFLYRVLANDIGKLATPGKALYSCMLNESGGVVDDLIVYYLGPNEYRMVVNAGTRDKDLAWLRTHAARFQVVLAPRTDLALIAVQGPRAREKAATLFGSYAAAALAIKPFSAQQIDRFFVARTGYTGEDGFELMVPAVAVLIAWDELQAASIAPCGLGARDTLRLEAGMNLYGNDMDDAVSPLESGLEWTVAFAPQDHDFIGRAALDAQRRAGVSRKLVGLLLEGRGVLRSHQKVIAADGGAGELTSGTFSPTLQRSIGFARVPITVGEQVHVDIRGQLQAARVVRYPFVRNGKILVAA